MVDFKRLFDTNVTAGHGAQCRHLIPAHRMARPHPTDRESDLGAFLLACIIAIIVSVVTIAIGMAK